jgi:Head fiber protein
MADQTPVHGVVLSGNSPRKNQYPMRLVLTDSAGNPSAIFKPAAAQADSTAADVATLKTDFNALLAKLRTAGIIAP